MRHNALINLLKANATAPRAYRVVAKADDTAEIFMHEMIGYDWWTGGGITAKQFAKDIAALDAKTIVLRINSPGGDVFEARAIIAAMASHPAKFVARVEGYAASAASVIAANCAECEMVKGSFQMIHNAWTMAMGDRHAMLDVAALLEKIDNTIVDDYVARTGKERGAIVDWMDAETWFTADECVDNGFADRLIETANAAAEARAWNLSAYKHAPAAKDPAPTKDDDESAKRAAATASAAAARARQLALIDRTAA